MGGKALERLHSVYELLWADAASMKAGASIGYTPTKWLHLASPRRDVHFSLGSLYSARSGRPMIPDKLFPHINQPKIPVSGEMMANVRAGYEQRLCDLVESSEQLMAALRAVRCLGLPSWCIGAGAIRSLVWDNLHGFQVPSNVDDVDVAYFDAKAPLALDAELQERLHLLLPSVTWEVTNQARVHEWFAEALGQVVSPLTSLDDGLATWPEFATCVGIYLDGDESLKVIAPYGLNDLFELRVRHNPRRASISTFMHRVNSKRFSHRWPRLSICTP